MMRYLKQWMVPLVVAVVAMGCNQDDCEDFNPTPYVLQIPEGLPSMDPFIPADNPMTVEGVALGRKLFYDPLLSDDNSQSCGTCHLQEHGFAEPQQHSVGIDGSVGTRNAMALINLGWNPNGFFWDGRAATLEDLVFQPVTNPIEMNTTWPEVEAKLNENEEYRVMFAEAFNIEVIDSVHVSKAIAQFLRTLISANSKFDQYSYQQSVSLSNDELAGLVLFQSNEGADCFHCHTLGGHFTTNEFQNNGMDVDVSADEGRYLVTGDENDKGKFRVPTLRNIELTAPYMHDGRFFTLQEVLDHYSEHVQATSPNIDFSNMQHAEAGGVQLEEFEKQQLLAFLKTLTDPSFVNNPELSDPNP